MPLVCPLEPAVANASRPAVEVLHKGAEPKASLVQGLDRRQSQFVMAGSRGQTKPVLWWVPERGLFGLSRFALLEALFRPTALCAT
ncbi:hypothetical protein ATO13_23611 [Stappia sp. 22II-S9-Z10]|nr:hypothetical protein ATO13_23611 [Stappia sp. 22II-S9-Z10]